MDRLLTVEEEAARLGTPTRLERRLVAERRIPFSKIGKYVRVPRRDIDSFIDAGRIEPSVRSSVAK
jgi:excisionase family DNA binding protein